jgi:hypothetical protein
MKCEDCVSSGCQSLTRISAECYTYIVKWKLSDERAERDRLAAPKVNAKTLRQKDRTGTILRRARRRARTKGATGSYEYAIYAEGNLSGNDGGMVSLRVYYAYFICR